MNITHVFILDLRCSGEEVQRFASMTAEALWEYVLFIAASSSIQDCVLSIQLFVIDNENKLFRFFRDEGIDLEKCQVQLRAVASLNLSNPITVSQDPMNAAIDLASFNSISSIIIFEHNSAPFFPEIERGWNRIHLAHGSTEICVAVVGSLEEDLATKYAESGTLKVVKFQEEDSHFFMFLRSLDMERFYPPSHDILSIGKNEIHVEISQLIGRDVSFSPIRICQCHEKPLSETIPQHRCRETNKRVPLTRIDVKYSIGSFPLSIECRLLSSSKLIALKRLSLDHIDDQFFFGTAQIMTSDSNAFFRLLTEMRANQQGILARREPSLVIGGEYWIITPDQLVEALYCRRFANRFQVLRLENIPFAREHEVYDEPILTVLEQTTFVNVLEFNRLPLSNRIIDHIFYQSNC